MTQERILELAFDAVLNIWHEEHKRLKENPNNAIRIARERRAYEEMKEIQNLIINLLSK